jgi:protein-tyrosine phosphatase
MATIIAWRPAMVLTMTTEIELEAAGAEALPDDLARAGVVWRHLPVTDFRAPCASVASFWPGVSAEARQVMAAGGRVLVHCYGGCGRSGMALMRLMVDAGEAPDAALERLRAVRPCAVETAAQFGWAGEAAANGALAARVGAGP